MEVIATGYILIENSKKISIEKVTGTQPIIPRGSIKQIIDTAKAGELLGMKRIYLETGSGVKMPVQKK